MGYNVIMIIFIFLYNSPIIVPGILGIYLLTIKRLSVSSTTEISGGVLKFLAFSYLCIAFITNYFVNGYIADIVNVYPVSGICILFVTIVSIFFAKPKAK